MNLQSTSKTRLDASSISELHARCSKGRLSGSVVLLVAICKRSAKQLQERAIRLQFKVDNVANRGPEASGCVGQCTGTTNNDSVNHLRSSGSSEAKESEGGRRGPHIGRENWIDLKDYWKAKCTARSGKIRRSRS